MVYPTATPVSRLALGMPQALHLGAGARNSCWYRLLWPDCCCPIYRLLLCPFPGKWKEEVAKLLRGEVVKLLQEEGGPDIEEAQRRKDTGRMSPWWFICPQNTNRMRCFLTIVGICHQNTSFILLLFFSLFFPLPGTSHCVFQVIGWRALNYFQENTVK